MAVEQLMTNAMNQPDVLLIGVAVGFVTAKIMNMRRNSMGMGGGF